MTADPQRQRRTTRLQARRAADELLIEAIFGDMLLARLARTAEANTVATASLPVAATATLR